MSKFNLNKLAPMLDKTAAGLAKAGKAAVEIAKDRNFQIGVLTALPTTVTAFFLIKSTRSKLKKKNNCTKRRLLSIMRL